MFLKRTFGIAAVVLTMAACSPPDATAPKEHTVQQEIGSPRLRVGLGYDEGTQDFKSNICINDFHVDVGMVDRMYMRAFQTYNEAEVALKVSGALDIDVDAALVKLKFGNNLKGYYDNSSVNRATLAIMVHFESVSRFLINTTGSPPVVPESVSVKCDPGNPITQFDTVQAFLDNCGDRYIQSQIAGGMAFLTVDVSSLSLEERKDLESKLHISVKKGFPGDIDASFNYFASSSSKLRNLEYTVTVHGVPAPDPSLLNANDKLTADKWSAYVNQVRQTYKEAHRRYRNGLTDAYDDDLGVVLKQDFQEYTIEDLERCDRNGEGFRLLREQLHCYQSFWARDTYMYADEKLNDFKKLRDEVRWALNNPSKIIWQTPVPVTQAEYQAALDHYNMCRQERPNVRERCEEAREDGNIDDLCGACAHPPGCHPEELKKRFNKLAEVNIKPADPKPTPPIPTPAGPAAPLPHSMHTQTQNLSNSMQNAAAYLCVWSGFSGRMSGLAEGTSVDVSPIGFWTLNTFTAQNKFLRSNAICMPRQNFYGHISNDWQNDSVTFWSTSARKDELLFFQGPETVFALSGIAGKMSGGSEYAKMVKHLLGGSHMEMGTQQGVISGWAHLFGLHDPHNNTVRYAGSYEVNVKAGRFETQMTPSGSTLCYLTEVRGKFSGGAEKVDIVERDGNWVLTADSIKNIYLNAANTVFAKAECIYFDQSISNP